MSVDIAFQLVRNLHDAVRRQLGDARQAGLIAPAVDDVFAIFLDRHAPHRNDYTVVSCVDSSHDDCVCPGRYVFHCPVCLLSFPDEQTERYPCHVVQAVATALVGVTS